MVTGKATPQLTGLDTVRGAIDTIEQYFENGWTDGLPIVPPTEELVERMIAASGRDALEVVGVVPPRQGVATIEAIATNAVMGLVEPQSNGIGGDLFAIVSDGKTGALHGLNACGWAPACCTEARNRLLSMRPWKIGTPSSTHFVMTSLRSSPASRASSVGVR